MEFLSLDFEGYSTKYISVYTIESCIALDCYSCYSKNGSDRTCDDPMIRMYKDVIDPVPCVLPTPMKNYQNDPHGFIISLQRNVHSIKYNIIRGEHSASSITHIDIIKTQKKAQSFRCRISYLLGFILTFCVFDMFMSFLT